MRPVFFVLCLLAPVLVPLPPAGHPLPDLAAPGLRAGLSLSPGFAVNTGQTDERVACYAPVPGGTAFVTREGALVYSLSPGHVVTETAVGGEAKATATDPTPTRVSRFLGDDSAKWQPDLPTYSTVDLGTVWPGVRVRLSATGSTVEKVFTVAPGGDPNRIRMRVGGADALTVHEDGSLRVGIGNGHVVFSAPHAWQNDGAIAAAYRIEGNEYGFTLGDYDPSRPVHIDPLIQGTFLGGGANDRIFAMGIHPESGLVYVTGSTRSVDFPETAGGAAPDHLNAGANEDVFVAVFSTDLTTLIRATYYGGRTNAEGILHGGDEAARALAFHPTTGEVWITGYSTSTNLPNRTGNAQYDRAGEMDAFVAVLSADLTNVVGSTFFGGHGREIGNGIAFYDGPLAHVKWACVAGETTSLDLPGIWNESLQQTFGGGARDGFLAHIRDDLAYYQSTWLGGAADDAAHAIAIDNDSHVIYVAGETGSEDFPALENGWRDRLSGASDGFVARFPRALPSFVGATLIGGSGQEVIHCVAVHPHTKEVYFGGWTSSTDLPLAGGFQRRFGGGARDGFVGRIGADITRSPLLSYLGGTGNDTVRSLSIDGSVGWVYAAGETMSPDLGGDGAGAQSLIGGDQDAFAARISGHLLDLPALTYLGGAGRESGYAVAVASGRVYLAGVTSTASGAWLASSGGGQPNHGDGTFPNDQDSYVARFDLTLGAAPLSPGTFVMSKGLVKLAKRGWKLQLKKGVFDPGWESYTGTGDDIRIIIDGVEYFPLATREVLLKKKKLVVRDPAQPKSSFSLAFKGWKYKLKLADVPEGDLDPTDGVSISVTLMGRECEVTLPRDPVKTKKLMPTTTVPK